MADDRPELYLIAHRVRGEPAFDVAQRLLIGDEEGWIIPTSGHRAYPFWHTPLYQADLNGNIIVQLPSEAVERLVPPCPPDWPDHYSATAAPKGQGEHSASDLISALGLGRPKVVVTRRI